MNSNAMAGLGQPNQPYYQQQDHLQSLPPGWEQMYDQELRRVFFVDHTTQTTSWVDPRDRYTKKPSFALCEEDELPYGWARAYDGDVGDYYVDHNTWTTHLPEDMEVYFAQQHTRFRRMIGSHHTDLRHHYMVLSQERAKLVDAERELEQLRAYLAMPGVDPAALRGNIATARARIERLQQELARLERHADTKKEGLGVLESQFANLAEDQDEQPFYDHAAEAEEKLRELERINTLAEQQMRERSELAMLTEEQLMAAGASGDHDTVHEQRLRLKELESKLISKHLQQMNSLKDQLASTRSRSNSQRKTDASQRLTRSNSRRRSSGRRHQNGSKSAGPNPAPGGITAPPYRSSTAPPTDMINGPFQTEGAAEVADLEKALQHLAVSGRAESVAELEGRLSQRQAELEAKEQMLLEREAANQAELQRIADMEQKTRSRFEQDESIRLQIEDHSKQDDGLRHTVINMKRVFDDQQRSLQQASMALEEERRLLMSDTEDLDTKFEKRQYPHADLCSADALRREAEDLQAQHELTRQRTMDQLQTIETLNREIAVVPVDLPARSSSALAASTLYSPNASPKAGRASAGTSPAAARAAARFARGGSSGSLLNEDRSRSNSLDAAVTLKTGQWDKLRRAFHDKVALTSWLQGEDDAKIQGIFKNKSEVEMVVTLQRLMRLRELRQTGPSRPERQSFSQKLEQFQGAGVKH